MSVQQMESNFPPARLPHDVEILLQETAESLENWEGSRESHEFVPADYVLVYDALCTVRSKMPPSPTFVEWGSGLGIVTMLASALGWNAHGIEIEPDLVNESRHFAEFFDFPVRIHRGSFFPGEPHSIKSLTELCGKADIIYVYPWPDQEIKIFDLFNRLAKPGAYLLTYYGIEDLRLFRKK